MKSSNVHHDNDAAEQAVHAVRLLCIDELLGLLGHAELAAKELFIVDGPVCNLRMRAACAWTRSYLVNFFIYCPTLFEHTGVETS